jgi:proteasome activator subunit 4
MLSYIALKQIIMRINFPRAREPILQSSLSHVPAVHALVKHARRFFSPSATKEIMEMFLSEMSPHCIDHSKNRLSNLSLFIPTLGPPPPPLESLQSDTTPFYWIPTLFCVWSQSKSDLDKSMITILGRLVKSQIAFPWNLCLNENHVGQVFSAGLRYFGLPVGSGISGSTLSGRGGSRNLDMVDSFILITPFFTTFYQSFIRSFAVFIVYTIYPQGGDVDFRIPSLKTLAHLRNLSKYPHISLESQGLTYLS